MAFRYINPGYGDLLNGSSVVTTENNFVYNPKHGISFWKTASSLSDSNKIFVPQAFTSDICAKFSMYVGDSFPDNFYLGAMRTNSSNSFYYRCIGLYIEKGKAYLLAGYPRTTNGGMIGTSYLGTLENNSLNKIQFHIHRGEDAESSFGELTINGVTQKSFFSSRNYSNPSFSDDKAFFIQFPTSQCDAYISELIISDEYISPREKIAILPISSTTSDMIVTGNNGVYIADAAEQTLLQTPDVADLITAYGANSSITGIAVAGNPAYRTGAGITTLTGLSKVDDITTEHDSCTLGTDSLGGVLDGWKIENTTIADLQNMQFGWKVGE